MVFSHIKNIFSEGELGKAAVVVNYATTAPERLKFEEHGK